MKIIKISISLTIALMLILSAVFSVGAYRDSYNRKGLAYATPVENQKKDEDCIYYALLSAAGTYCVKNNAMPREEADFNEKALKSKIGKTTNFGEVLYSAVGFDIGGGNYITGIESLPVSKTENRAIKKKINENGAVCAAIYLPDGGMADSKYYSDKNYTFNCPESEIGTSAHAFDIVGYDDSFEAESFLCKSNPGAWVCKNSYGTSYGNGGYFYLSYDYPLLYAASVEVTQIREVSKIKRADNSLFNFRQIGAFGFKSASARKGSEIILKSGDKTVYRGQADLIKGYNSFALGDPFSYGEIELTVDGERINNESVYLYYLKNGQVSVEFSKPSGITGWVQRAKELNIIISSGNKANVYAMVEDTAHPENTVSLSMPYLIKDKGDVIISPASGVRFDEDTIVNYEMKDHNDRYHTVKDTPFSDFTDKESRYVRLLEDGRVTALNLNIQGAFVKGIDIITDDKSEITSAKLIFDENTEVAVEAKDLNIKKFISETGNFSLEFPGTRTEDTARRSSYYATLEIENYYVADDFEILLNGKPAAASSEYKADDSNGGFEIGIVIDIPDVKSVITLLINSFADILSKLFELFR